MVCDMSSWLVLSLTSSMTEGPKSGSLPPRCLSYPGFASLMSQGVCQFPTDVGSEPGAWEHGAKMTLQPWTRGTTTGLFVLYLELFPRASLDCWVILCVGAVGFLSLLLQKAARQRSKCKVLAKFKFLIKFQNTEQGVKILKYSIFPRSWSPVVGVHPGGTRLCASVLWTGNIKVIFPAWSQISKSTQGVSSLVLLKPIGGRVSCWAHLCNFHKDFESKRRSQRRTMKIAQSWHRTKPS